MLLYHWLGRDADHDQEIVDMEVSYPIELLVRVDLTDPQTDE